MAQQHQLFTLRLQSYLLILLGSLSESKCNQSLSTQSSFKKFLQIILNEMLQDVKSYVKSLSTSSKLRIHLLESLTYFLCYLHKDLSTRLVTAYAKMPRVMANCFSSMHQEAKQIFMDILRKSVNLLHSFRGHYNSHF